MVIGFVLLPMAAIIKPDGGVRPSHDATLLSRLTTLLFIRTGCSVLVRLRLKAAADLWCRRGTSESSSLEGLDLWRNS